MSTNKQVLRQLASRATPGPWTMEHENIWYSENGYTKHLAYFCQGDDVDDNQDDVNTQYVAAADPTTVLALLDELEAAGNRINRLESIVAVAEKRNALMREWKRALKVPCDLVDDQVPVVIHGMVVRLDRLKETEEKLAAAEKRIAEQEAPAVTVKLPMPYDINVAGEHVDWEKGDHFDRDEVIAALAAAGITVKGE